MQDFLPFKCVTFPTMSFKTLNGMIIVKCRRREKWGMCK
jgi:hypothetical protein